MSIVSVYSVIHSHCIKKVLLLLFYIGLGAIASIAFGQVQLNGASHVCVSAAGLPSVSL